MLDITAGLNENYVRSDQALLMSPHSKAEAGEKPEKPGYEPFQEQLYKALIKRLEASGESQKP